MENTGWQFVSTHLGYRVANHVKHWPHKGGILLQHSGKESSWSFKTLVSEGWQFVATHLEKTGATGWQYVATLWKIK